MLARLCRENAAVPPQEILQHTQKLLDRVLFCAFCEDRGLLPADTLIRDTRLIPLACLETTRLTSFRLQICSCLQC